MDNPVIQTDIADVLGQINQKLDKIDDRLGKLEVGQAEIRGDIKALDAKVEQLDKRVGKLARSLAPFGDAGSLANQEFTNRGVLIGLIVVILGGAAKLFGMVGNP